MVLLLSNDSEHSTCSTFTVHQEIHKPLHQQECFQTKLSRKSKRVQFDESLNQSFANVEQVAEDCRQSWYTKQDFNSMRTEMQNTIQQLRKKDKKMQGQVSQPLQALLDLVSSINHVVEDPTSIVSAEMQQRLSQLFTHGEDSFDLIGLEMHIESRLRRTAKEHREYIQEVVYDIQKEQLAGLLSDDEVHFELRDSCLNYSQAFVLLAQIMASAQLSAQ
ncbi:hypothetical protein ACA910_021230 [Epithemia clementina (nom. ined.)]